MANLTKFTEFDLALQVKLGSAQQMSQIGSLVSQAHCQQVWLNSNKSDSTSICESNSAGKHYAPNSRALTSSGQYVCQ